MKRAQILLLGVAGLLAAPLVARAVSGKHGQLESQDPFKTGRTACALCHSTHGGKGLRMWVVTPATHTANGRELCGSSALCYSCHDGTVTKKGQAYFDYTERGMTGGGRGGSSHPVNLPLTDTQSRPSWATLFTGTVGANTYSDVLTCGTCHDPHDDRTHGHYLKASTKDSLLCRACHTNK